jgi:hypothetical protein
VFYPRYLLAALPGWIGITVAGWPFWPRLRWLTPVLGGLIFLAPTGISLANNYANPEYERIDYRPAIDLIRQEALPGEAVIYDSPNAATRGGHYVYEQPLPAIALPPPVNKAATIAELERLTIEHDGLWVLLYGQLDIDRDNTVETWLDSNELPILDRSFGANWYRLKHYRSAPVAVENALLPGGFSVNRTAGPLRLVQARVAPLAPAMMVDLLWAIDRPAGGDYVVSLQLLAEDRHKIAQMDSEPFLGGYPTSQWNLGLAYSDSVQLKPGPVAPGAYALLLAVYPAGKPEQSQQLQLGGYELGHSEFMPRGT